MTVGVPRLPFSFDPLIAEAKHRARQRRARIALGVLLVAGLAAGLTFTFRASGSAYGSAGLSHDSLGHPYITDAQGRAIGLGTLDSVAFDFLGGRSAHGVRGPGHWVGYDYPIRGTGTGDAGAVNQNYVWWRFCVMDGRVLGKFRGRPDSPTFSCSLGESWFDR